MTTHHLLIGLATCLCCSSAFAANSTKSIMLTSFDKQKRLRDLVDKYKSDHQPQKFTVVAGTIFGSFKDKSSNSPLKGRNKANVISFGYQATPEFSASTVFVKSKTYEKTADENLRVKSADDTMAVSVDYKILRWLKLDFSFASKQGKTKTSELDEINFDSISKNTSRTPSLYLKMVFQVNEQFFVAPDVGFSRSYIHNKAYIDNAGIAKPKKDLTLDQTATNTKLGYVFTPNIIPYASMGYSRTLHYSAHLKSRDSFRAGAGAILFGGILNLDWTASKANKSVTSNTFSVNLAGKF